MGRKSIRAPCVVEKADTQQQNDQWCFSAVVCVRMRKQASDARPLKSHLAPGGLFRLI